MGASNKSLPTRQLTALCSGYLLPFPTLFVVTHGSLPTPRYILLHMTNIFISNLNEETGRTTWKFSVYPRLAGFPLRGISAAWRIDLIETSWSLATAKAKSSAQYGMPPTAQARHQWTWKQPCREPPGVQVDGKLNGSQQCALAAMKTKCALFRASKSTTSRLKKVIITISSALALGSPDSVSQDRHHHTGASQVEDHD